MRRPSNRVHRAASTISVVTKTKTLLSALATAATGANSSIDKNFFGQQTFGALGMAMQARRDVARRSIIQNERLAVADYTLEAARCDLISYFFAGTLPGAIQEIQHEAAVKSAATTQASGDPAKLAVTSSGGAKNAPVSIRVEVQDASGRLVTSATNSVTISTTPADAQGTLTASAVSGVATFSIKFGTVGPYQVTARAAALADGTASVAISAEGTPAVPAVLSTPALRLREGIH